jgi:hypothetical protein
LRVEIADIKTLLPCGEFMKNTFSYTNTNTNITSTINTHHAAAQPRNHSRTGGDPNAGMMKGYATLLQPTTPAAGSRDEAVSLSFPSAPSLSIARSPSPVNRVHCSTPHKPRSAAKHPRRHAMRVQYCTRRHHHHSCKLLKFRSSHAT